VAAVTEGAEPAQGSAEADGGRCSGVTEPGDDGGGDRRDPEPPAGEPDVPGDDGGGLLRGSAPVGGGDAPAAGAESFGNWVGEHEVVEADIDYDEPGEPKTDDRTVPIPPRLVALLRSWIEEHGLGDDDLLFRTRNDRRPAPSNWSWALQRACRTVGHPPLRVYDLRHAWTTTWLRAGVPLGEVARRLGHSVETLVSTYVGALQGDDVAANKLIDATLATTRELIVADPADPSHALPTRSRKTGRKPVTRGNSRARR
jgi:hypothetical protein